MKGLSHCEGCPGKKYDFVPVSEGREPQYNNNHFTPEAVQKLLQTLDLENFYWFLSPSEKDKSGKDEGGKKMITRPGHNRSVEFPPPSSLQGPLIEDGLGNFFFRLHAQGSGVCLSRNLRK